MNFMDPKIKLALSGQIEGSLRFKTLLPEDVTLNYLDWFKDPEVIKFIDFARESVTIESLREFVSLKLGAPDAILLGIFDGFEHVGNIKFEPVDLTKKIAGLGILIGSEKYRSIGLGSAAISRCSKLIKEVFGISRFELGVKSENVKAIKAYLKCGFFQTEFGEIISKGDGIIMRLDL